MSESELIAALRKKLEEDTAADGFAGSVPQSEPGSRWEYSNYGFVLLGLVIEKVSGQSYYDYVREHIYEPAGMTSSGSEPEDQAVADRSIGYTKMGGGKWHPNTDTLPLSWHLGARWILHRRRSSEIRERFAEPQAAQRRLHRTANHRQS